MPEVWDKVKALLEKGDIRISAHGYDELAEDNIAVKELIENAVNAVVIEEYPEFSKGEAVLVCQKNKNNEHFHAVWGIPKGNNRPAVLVTSYRPDSEIWSDDFLTRVK